MNETLEDVASVEEQPTSEAVAIETPGSGVPAPDPSATDASVTTEQPPARLWAAKYKSAEEMERGYLDSQREASRMAGELAASKRTTPDPAVAEPKWKQLESERNKWAAQYRNPQIDESARQQADEQVRLYDREIAKQQAISEYRVESRRTGAESRMEQESTTIIEQYRAQLSDTSSALYQSAAQRLQDLLDMGMPDTNTTKSMAISHAAAMTGSHTQTLVQQDRKTLLKTLNTQARQSVVAGAGGPTTVRAAGVTAKDIEQMSPKEFLKYERDQLRRA